MSRRVARPYAVALFEVTRRESIAALRELEEQLASVARVFRSVPELLRVFEVPSVAPGDKRALVDTMAKALELRPEAHRMLVALEHHARLRYLDEVASFFGALVDRKEGIVRGSVELPTAPREEQVTALTRALAEALDARVELDVKVRKELLAGFVVRVGSQVFDGSLLAQARRFASSAPGE
jgi:F-type H+-transporting ATPase subunit delta